MISRVLKMIIVVTVLGAGLESLADSNVLENLHFEGASITAGQNATLPLELRVKAQLTNLEKPELLAKLASTRTLVSIDYFFPTNFPLVDTRYGTDAELTKAVVAKVTTWLHDNQQVVIGLLPVTGELSPELQTYLSGAGKAFAGSYRFLSNCCATKSAKVNAILRAMAQVNPRLHLLSMESALKAYMENPLMQPKAAALFMAPDPIHLNDFGQAVLFNFVMKPALEATWSVKLKDMRVEKISSGDANAIWHRFTKRLADFKNRVPGLYRASLFTWGLHSGQLVTGAQPKADLILNRLRTIDDIISLTSLRSFEITVPIEIRADGTLVLNLVQALFYVPIPLSPEAGQWHGYGYDVWDMAYNRIGPLFGSYKKSGPKGQAVGTNYEFIVKPSPTAPEEMSVAWRIYPLIEAQNYRQPFTPDRQPVLRDANAKNDIAHGGGSYAHVLYKLKLKVQD